MTGQIPSGNGRGRPPKPTALKVLHGDFKKNPQRQNRNEPRILRAEIEKPYMSQAAGTVWDDLAPHLMMAGILTAPDAKLFAEFCESTVLVRLARVQIVRGMTTEDPTVWRAFGSYQKAVSAMIGLGSRFGLTPADRSRLIVDNDEQADDLISSG